MSNESWIAHAYPLQQLTVKLQGTRHSDKAAIIGQLEVVLAHLKAGDTFGYDHDDDFGYAFEYVRAVPGPSFFEEPAGSSRRKAVENQGEIGKSIVEVAVEQDAQASKP